MIRRKLLPFVALIMLSVFTLSTLPLCELLCSDDECSLVSDIPVLSMVKDHHAPDCKHGECQCPCHTAFVQTRVIEVVSPTTSSNLAAIPVLSSLRSRSNSIEHPPQLS